MTTRERLERKMEKRMEWAEGRKEKATIDWEKGDLREEKSGIPLGQPILVGHHSENGHRNAIDRAARAWDRALENENMAKLHASKAAGIADQLAGSIFSDDENAVEALEAKIATLEREREQNNQVNVIIRKAPKNIKTDEKIEALKALGLRESTAEKLFEPDFCGRIGIASYVNQNLGGRIKASKDRLAGIKIQKANQTAAQSSESGVLIKTNAYGNIFVTFAEKPSREILNALKAAGYRWYHGSWIGAKDKLPECVRALESSNKA